MEFAVKGISQENVIMRNTFCVVFQSGHEQIIFSTYTTCSPISPPEPRPQISLPTLVP